MRNRILNTTTIAAAIAVCVALVSGCSDGTGFSVEEPNGAENAPALPAVSTMKFELNFFGVEAPVVDQQSLKSGGPATAAATSAGEHANWINAFVRALYVQLITYDNLSAPVAAFALAIHSVPQEVEPGTYLWTYIFIDDGTEYSIFLYGTPQTDRVVWRMEVSSNDAEFALDHFVWFDGESMKDDSAGFWQFYEPIDASSGEETARIDWTKSAEQKQTTITVNGASHEDSGDYLEFTESDEMGSIVHYDASEDLLSDITWYADGSGSLMVPDYNNGDPACWDTEQVNADCE